MAYKIKSPKKQIEIEHSGKYPEIQWEEKGEKQDDIFKVPDNETEEEEQKLFQMQEDKDQFIQDLNDDLSADNVPIKVKDKYTLIVKAHGQNHTVTRRDVDEYTRKYGLEDGSSEHPITNFRRLGSINADYKMLEPICKDVNKVFGEIDEHTGSFKTVESDDY